MDSFIRFLQDILGYFMEKVPPLWKVIILGGIAVILYMIGGIPLILNTISIVLWIISLFMFGLLLFNVIKDRNKEGPSV